MYHVAQHANGCALNGEIEYLLDESGERRRFVDREDAFQFLKEAGESYQWMENLFWIPEEEAANPDTTHYLFDDAFYEKHPEVKKIVANGIKVKVFYLVDNELEEIPNEDGAGILLAMSEKELLEFAKGGFDCQDRRFLHKGQALNWILANFDNLKDDLKAALLENPAEWKEYVSDDGDFITWCHHCGELGLRVRRATIYPDRSYLQTNGFETNGDTENVIVACDECGTDGFLRTW